MAYSSSLFKTYTNTLTTGTAVAYTQNDQIGDLQTLSNLFDNTTQVWRFAGGKVVDTDNLAAFQFSIFFFSGSVTLAADNAAYAVSDADGKKFIAMAGNPASAGNTVSAGGTNRLYAMPYYQGTSQNQTGEFYVCPDPGLDLYFCLIATGATTPAARTTANSIIVSTYWELVTP